ncbi:MAG: hypothetical protein ACKOYH_09775 [Cyanobium sp.]
MFNPRLSLWVFGLYMVLVVGVGFMVLPMPILHLFALEAGDDVWI